MQEADNVLRIFQEAKTSVAEENAVKLKELSNQTIHTASISQDPDNVAVAVIVYSLSKILERKRYQQYKGWKKFYKELILSIEHLINDLKENNEKHIKIHLMDINKSIENLSGELKTYIQDVFVKARINKASRIYEHGISMEKTASLLGISLFDLASYAGQTEISELPLGQTLDVKSRIKTAMEMFS